MVMAPMTWLRADFGFRMRPAAHTASIRRTRISAVNASTATSTKCAPKVDCCVFLARSPNSIVSSPTRPSWPAASASDTLRPPAMTWPSAKAAVIGSTPTLPATASRSFTQAAYTPAVELAAPHWPPEPAETGKLESPRRTKTLASGTPIISAAVWAMMV
jgi:hypothetical protein